MNVVGFLLRVAVAVLAAAPAFADDALVPIPVLRARVTDTTGTLDAARAVALDQRLAEFETRKGAQVAVLLVATTQPEPIEAYATRVFDAWKLGRKDINDGVLVIVAKNDRRTRIEVGYGLEGAIPDAAAKRVAHDYMSPKFAAGDFDGGLDAGVDWLTRLIDGEPLPAARPAQVAQSSDPIVIEQEPWWSPIGLVVGIMFGAILSVVLVLLLGLPMAYRFLLGHFPAGARVYAFGVLNALPIAFFVRHPMAALGAFAAGSSLASLMGLSKPPRRGGGFSGGGGGGYSGGGGSGSGGSSSGGGGGGFSGGGGSSGGGGASDSW